MNWLNIISVSFLMGLFPILDFPALDNQANAATQAGYKAPDLQNNNNFKMVTLVEYKKF